MLDVHPPHAPTHTWRDFFIHIATISVGLLIAIGLEQSVEWVHHRQERRELIEDMHTEAERAVTVLDEYIKIDQAQEHWADSVLDLLVKAKPVGGLITVSLPPFPPDVSRIPPRSTWAIAKTNGTAALMPRNLAEIYTRLEFNSENYLEAHREVFTSANHMNAAYLRISKVHSLVGDTKLRCTVAERDELMREFSMYEVTRANQTDDLSGWAGAADAVVHNVASRDDMDAYMKRRQEALSK